jgi:hypothetical protein
MWSKDTGSCLPLEAWPEADHEAFRAAYEPGDVFEETGGPGAHLTEGTRGIIRTAYRRWLGFLAMRYPDDLLKSPVARITPERVRGFIDSLSAEIRPTSLVIVLDNLCYAARLIAPRGDWGWLASIKARLAARALLWASFQALTRNSDTPIGTRGSSLRGIRLIRRCREFTGLLYATK